ncbi:MAG TPA: sugar ABC transporter substrate-binding protein [Armatimonadota bacterium]|nr:sugar ABC transporter substrate-binding protein [Armatimonadota bacterium]
MRGRIALLSVIAIALVSAIAIALLPGCKKPAAKKQLEVGLVSPALTSVFHVTLRDGALEQAAKQNWKLIDMAPEKETDFARQVDMIENLIQLNVKAVSICAIDDKAIVGAVKKANEAGIPIFIHNSLTPIPGGEVTAYIGYDQRDGGRKCGEKAAQLLTEKYGKPKGKVVILEGITGFHTRERSGGFKEALAKYPNIEIVADQTADWDREKAVSVTENLLQSFKDIDLFFGCSDAMAQGASAAAKRAGRQVFTIGLDGNPDAIADVGKGNLTATLAVYPKEMGMKVVEVMKDQLDGKKVPKFVERPTTIVDKSNWEQFK